MTTLRAKLAQLFVLSLLPWTCLPAMASGSLFTEAGQQRFDSFCLSLKIILPVLFFFKSSLFLWLASRPQIVSLLAQVGASLLLAVGACCLTPLLLNSNILSDVYLKLLVSMGVSLAFATSSDVIVFAYKNANKTKALWLLLIANVAFSLTVAYILSIKFFAAVTDAMH